MAESLESRASLLTCHRRERSRQHVGPARQRPVRGGRHTLLGRHFHADASGPQSGDQLAIPRLIEPASNRFGQHGTDLMRAL